MKRRLRHSILLYVFFLFVSSSAWTQISHGGCPLFYSANSLLKSSGNGFFIEMPSFNLDSLLRDDELNESNMRGAFRFAEKFHVNIEIGKSGENYILPDGTKVWKVGIRSKGAYSINLFFSKFYLPEGGKLFIYNSSHTHVIGSFTSENNSEDNILPTRPVAGDEIIVEYQEPANAEFEALLKISEVNHDYRDLLNYEPTLEKTTYSCMPDVLCTNDRDNPNNRSSVLITINGTTACSASLINTTANNGEPLLLTAVHCLNDNFQYPDIDYKQRAGTIICFFNYNKPVCDLRMKATEEMSVAGSMPISIAIKNDMALLRLKENPPYYYKPYYAGWNVDPNANTNKPFVNIHHPEGSVGKYGNANKNLTLTNFNNDMFNAGSHWQVPSWDVGATAKGSSGSPLFDNNGLIMGGLTGGASTCSLKSADYFFALYKSWQYPANVGQILQQCLDPLNLGVSQCQGFDPYAKDDIVRLRNSDYNGLDSLINTKLTTPQSGFVFGHNSLNSMEFAEEFTNNKKLELTGVYIIAPSFNLSLGSEIKIKVYNQQLLDENVIATEVFRPTFTDYNDSAFGEKNKNMSSSPTETFVSFPGAPFISDKFYIAYEITYPTGSNFSVYNALFRSEKNNTAWIRNLQGNWFQASNHPYSPISTSLALEPLVKYVTDTKIKETSKTESKISYEKETKQIHIVVENQNESGILEIYSISGQLIERIALNGNSPINIPLYLSGKMMIVKAIFPKETYVEKIIF